MVFKTAMKVLDKGRLTMGAASVGAAEKLLNMSVDYARQRVQFRKPIGEFQMIQAMLADMATEIFAGRQMLYQAARLRDQGKRITREASMVKTVSAPKWSAGWPTRLSRFTAAWAT